MARRLFFIMAMMACACMAVAQGPGAPGKRGPRWHEPFNPARFEADLEQYIATEACLTPRESAQFFPLYREMRKKQMAFFNEMRRDRFTNFSDNKACERIIRESDRRDVEMKKLQQEYHTRFMKVLPASTVFRIIRAEDKFHRQMFKRAAGRDNQRRKR